MFKESKDLLVGNGGKTGAFRWLAAAIRAGCALYPVQCFGNQFEGQDGACALGAAQAGGWNLAEEGLGPNDGRPCPDCGRSGVLNHQTFYYGLPCSHAAALLPHLNDHHRWSREKIADWLENL